MKKIVNKVCMVVIILVATVFVTNKFNFFGDKDNRQNLIVAKPLSQVNFTNIDNENLENSQEKGKEEIKGYIEDNVQIINFDLQESGYPTLNLMKDVPVKLIINVDENSLNSCNYAIVSNDLNFEKQLEKGINIIEFTPNETGEFVYTCWMGMIGANINVVDEDIVPSAYYGDNVSVGGCCSTSR